MSAWKGLSYKPHKKGYRKFQLGSSFPDKPLVVREDGFAGITKGEPRFVDKLFNMDNLGSGINTALPYVSNMFNAFRTLPTVPTPEFQPLVTNPKTVNYEGDIAETDRMLRGLELGTQTSNPALGLGMRANNLGTFLTQRNRIRQTQQNTNADIINRTRQFNSFIEGQNTNRLNDYRRALVERQLAQQRLSSENLADFSNKVQLQKRDRSMMDLEKRKLELLPKFFQDTGIIDRNMLMELLKEIAQQKPQ